MDHSIRLSLRTTASKQQTAKQTASKPQSNNNMIHEIKRVKSNVAVQIQGTRTHGRSRRFPRVAIPKACISFGNSKRATIPGCRHHWPKKPQKPKTSRTSKTSKPWTAHCCFAFQNCGGGGWIAGPSALRGLSTWERHSTCCWPRP